MKKRSILLAMILVLGAFVFTACSSDGDETSNVEESTDVQEDDVELQKVTVAEMRSEFWIQAYLAESLGYFEEEGLDVEFITTTDGPVAFQAMHAGSSDFTMLSTEPVFRAQSEGLESKILLSTLKSKPYMLVGAEGIESVDDLKGKTIFAGMPGSAPHSFAISILEKNGMSEDDVEWAQMEYGASLGALENGQVAAIYLKSTAKDEAESAGGNILVDVSDPEQHKEIYGTDKYESSVIVGTKEFVENNEETVQSFVNAVTKAMNWFETASNKEVVESLKDLFEGGALTENQIEYLRASINPDGKISEEGHKTIVEFCLKEGIVEREISFEEAYDLSFLEKALNSN